LLKIRKNLGKPSASPRPPTYLEIRFAQATHLTWRFGLLTVFAMISAVKEKLVLDRYKIQEGLAIQVLFALIRDGLTVYWMK
jgi:hypothetical protein